MSSDSIPEISPQDLQRRLASEASARPALLDVRFEEERQTVKLSDSFWIPLPELAARADEVLGALGGKPLVVYCHHGVRSRHAAGLLRALGVEASSLAGGIDRYAAELDPQMKRY